MTVDPNWLLSTTAQSAAALVAIIGGLLVSRLVALNIEQGALDRRYSELQDRERLLREQRSEVARQAREIAYDWFRKSYVPKYVAVGGGELPPEEERVWFRGANKGDHDQWHRELGSEVSDAVVLLESTVTDITVSASELARQQPELRRIDRLVVQSWLEVRRDRERSALDRLTLGRRLRAPAVVDRQIERQDHHLERLTELDADLKAISAEGQLVLSHLWRLGKPAGVGWVIWALAAFALLGVVLPLSLQALRPVPGGPLTRAGVVVAFALGLSLVLMFIGQQWRALGAKKLDQDEARGRLRPSRAGTSPDDAGT